MRSEAEIRELREILGSESENTGSVEHHSDRWFQVAAAWDALGWVLGEEPCALDDEVVAHLKSKFNRRKSAARATRQ